MSDRDKARAHCDGIIAGKVADRPWAEGLDYSRASVTLDYLRGVPGETLSAADRAFLGIVWGGFGLPWERARGA